MKVNVARRKRQQTVFAGLDHNESVRNGYLYDMENLCGDLSPVLSVRKGRTKVRNIPNFHGIGSADGKLYWVSGSSFVYDGVKRGTVSNDDKRFGRLGNRILIWPDKKVYNINSNTFENIELQWSGSASFVSYTWDATSDEAADVYQGNAIKTTGTAFPFEVGDAVFVEGSSIEGNNRSAVIRKISEDKKMLIFTNNLFEERSEEALTLSRKAPEMEWFCELDNRLWGCKGDDIYACSLGLPKSWYDYNTNAGSSYAVPVGSDGDFTGAGVVGGYAVFFKEDAIHKIYGDKPSNFRALASAVAGTLDGRSVAVANETMYYLGRPGIMAYKGGAPSCVSGELGAGRFTHGVGGSDGRRYYASLYNGQEWTLYVYDTWNGLWFKEDTVQAVGFAMAGGVLHMVDAAGDLWSLNTESSNGVPWSMETGDFSNGDPDKAGIGKLQVRLELDASAEATVQIQFDSSGTWQTCRSVSGGQEKKTVLIPIIPRRCDHYRLRISGTGGCKIYSIAMEFYQASEI